MKARVLLQAVLSAALFGVCASLFALDVRPDASRARAETPRTDAPWVYLGPEVATVGRLAVSPQDPDHLLAALEVTNDPGDMPVAAGMFKSDNAGLHWAEADGFDIAVHDVLIDPQGRRLAVTEDGIHESTDGGNSWTLHFPADDDYPLLAQIALRSDGTGDLWARQARGMQQRVFRVEQPGFGAWHDLTPNTGPGFRLHALAVSDTHAGTVAVAGTNDTTRVTRVWVSTDDGASWSQRGQDLPPQRVSDLRFVGSRLLLAMGPVWVDTPAGLYASDDLGETWSALWGGVSAHTAVNQLAFDAEDHNHVWIATENEGLHRSVDGGQSWSVSVGTTQGLRARAVHHDASTGRLWLGIDGEGLWLSTDGGDSFTPRASMLNALPVASIAANVLDMAELAITTRGQASSVVRVRVMTTTDGGTQWGPEPHGASYVPGRVRFDRQGRLWGALTRDGSTNLVRREADGEWVDAGFQWPQGEYGEAVDMHFGDTDDTLVLAGHYFAGEPWRSIPALWRSTDGGDAWSLVHSGDESGYRYEHLQRLQTPEGVVLVALQTSFWMGTPGHLVVSTDNGLTWTQPVDAPPPFIRGALCTDGREMLVLMATFGVDTGLWRSFDAGSSWSATGWTPGPQGLNGGPYHALHCGRDSDPLVVGRDDGAVLLSTDGGHTFAELTAGLELLGKPVRAFHATPAGLYMGTDVGTWFHPALGTPPAGPTQLGVAVQAARMRTLADLRWTGGGAQVDVRRKGVHVATVANTGRYRDVIMAFQDRVALDWQVCDAGTDECSAVVAGP